MLLVLVSATIFGAIKGFAWQVASLASIIVSYFVSYTYRNDVAQMIDAREPWNLFLAMLLLYAGTTFVIWMVFRLISNSIDRVKLKEFDRHLGAAFGLIKGGLFCLLITMFAVTLLDVSKQEAICQSRSGYYISKFLANADGLLPAEVEQVVGPHLDSLENKLNQHQADSEGLFGTTTNANPFAAQGDSSQGGWFNTGANAAGSQSGGMQNPFGPSPNPSASNGGFQNGLNNLGQYVPEQVRDTLNDRFQNGFPTSANGENSEQGGLSGLLPSNMNPQELLQNGGRLPNTQQLQQMTNDAIQNFQPSQQLPSQNGSFPNGTIRPQNGFQNASPNSSGNSGFGNPPAGGFQPPPAGTPSGSGFRSSGIAPAPSVGGTSQLRSTSGNQPVGLLPSRDATPQSGFGLRSTGGQ
jgi:membrane protein required for colicin V production